MIVVHHSGVFLLLHLLPLPLLLHPPVPPSTYLPILPSLPPLLYSPAFFFKKAPTVYKSTANSSIIRSSPVSNTAPYTYSYSYGYSYSYPHTHYLYLSINYPGRPPCFFPGFLFLRFCSV